MADGGTHDERIVAKLGSRRDEFMLALMRTSPDCIKVLDRQGRIKQITESGMCVMEIDDPAQVTGKLWWLLWPEDQRAALQAVFKKALDGAECSYVGRATTARNTMKRWQVRLAPMRSKAGIVTGVMAVSRDITHF